MTTKRSYHETRKSNVSQWEKVRFEIHKAISQECEDAMLTDDCQDTDAVIGIFLDYAMTLEVVSQSCVDAASRIANQDMHKKMINAIKDDKDFISSYKKSMGNIMAKKYIVPTENYKFMMEPAEA